MIGLIFLILCLLAIFGVDTSQKRREFFGEDE